LSVNLTDPHHIAITGASSGIGLALAKFYARQGRQLSLAGRDHARLQATAKTCRTAGATVSITAFDQRDVSLSRNWIENADDVSPIDLLIANAGISGGTYGGSESESQVRAVFDVNVIGILNIVLPMISRMEQRGRGQIALMSSLAAHRGFPGAPAYSASKAAIKVWGEGLRGHCAPLGISVNVVMPGFIRTPMTDANSFFMPFLMPPEKAAGIIARGLARNKARIAFPFPTALMAWFLGTLSPAVTDPLLTRLPKKR